MMVAPRVLRILPSENPMPRLSIVLAAAMSLLVVSTSAEATIILHANLNNASENPPTVPTTFVGAPRPASFGTADFVLNTAGTAMTFTATIFNIDFTGTQTADTNDNLMNAHIHAAPAVTPTTNGPVVWGFIGSPFNDNNPNDVVVTPFLTGVGGTVSGKWDAPEGNGTTLAAQLDNILHNHAYINFHTVQFGGGEIRGNIFVVSEPSALALLGASVLGLFGSRIRRRRVQASTLG
jgi:hypothetical protein